MFGVQNEQSPDGMPPDGVSPGMQNERSLLSDGVSHNENDTLSDFVPGSVDDEDSGKFALIGMHKLPANIPVVAFGVQNEHSADRVSPAVQTEHSLIQPEQLPGIHAEQSHGMQTEQSLIQPVQLPGIQPEQSPGMQTERSLLSDGVSHNESDTLSDVVPGSADDENSVEFPLVGMNKLPDNTPVVASSGPCNTGLLRVALVQKNHGRRVWDKSMSCCFCKSVLKNKISEHLTKVHALEHDVARILVKPARSMERKWGWERLKNLGNFNNNVAALSTGAGEVIVKRRSHNRDNPDDFLPCEYCYGFVSSKLLWKHARSCHFRAQESDDTQHISHGLIARSQMLLEGARPVAVAADNMLFDDLVVQKMRNDAAKLQVKGDSLITNFGSVLLRRLGHTKIQNIAQRMRQLGRLKLQLRNDLKINESRKLQLTDFITGTRYDTVLAAVGNLCGIVIDDENRIRSVKKPSLALKFGHTFAKVAQIKKGIAIRNSDNVMRQEAEGFASLHEIEYTDKVSCVALGALRQRKYNKPEVLPLTEDLLTLKSYQQKLLKQLTEQLEQNHAYDTYRQLLEVVLSRLIIFNKRRGGEAARLLLSSYTERPNWHQTANSEILQSLQPLERKIFERLDMVQLPGKRQRKVPMLITDDVKRAMDVIVSNRGNVGVPHGNPYFFATQITHNHLLDISIVGESCVTWRNPQT